jgi:hypothetical protein
MGISVLTPPDTWGLVKNEVEVEFTTDNRYSTTGVKYSTILANLINPSDGDTLSFTWGTTTITFTFKTVATDCLHIQIPSPFTGAALKANMESAFRKQYYIQRDFYLGLPVAAGFSIQAKNTGIAYNITWGGTAFPTKFNHSGSNPIVGVDAVERTGYKMVVGLFAESGYATNFFEEKVEWGIFPDKSNNFSFFIHKALWAVLGFDTPSYNSHLVEVCTNIFRRYFLRYAEYYDGAVQSCYTPTDNYYALNGAFNWNEFFGNTFLNDYITSNINRRFLTSVPRGTVTVTEEQQWYLYCYIKSFTPDAIAYIDVRWTYLDGTTGAQNGVLSAVNYDGIAIIPVGYSQLGLSGLVAGPIKYYEVSVRQDAEVTEWFKINLSQQTFLYNRYFLFQNTFGAFEGLWCRGESEESSVASRDTFSVAENKSTTTIIVGTQQPLPGIRQNNVKVNTGTQSREYIRYLQSLLLSQRVFEIIGGKFVEIIVDPNGFNTPFLSDEDRRPSLEFSYTYAQEETI